MFIHIKTRNDGKGTSVTRFNAADWLRFYFNQYDGIDTVRELLRAVNDDYRADSDRNSAGNVCTTIHYNARRKQIVEVTSW